MGWRLENPGWDALSGLHRILKEKEMKLTFGRKFLGMLLGTIVLVVILFVIGLNVEDAITANVLIVYAILIVTLIMSYIGGTVWNNWIKSKYFTNDRLQDKQK